MRPEPDTGDGTPDDANGPVARFCLFLVSFGGFTSLGCYLFDLYI